MAKTLKVGLELKFLLWQFSGSIGSLKAERMDELLMHKVFVIKFRRLLQNKRTFSKLKTDTSIESFIIKSTEYLAQEPLVPKPKSLQDYYKI